MSRKVLETCGEEAGGEKKNPPPTPPEYKLDPLAFPSLDGAQANFFVCWRGGGAKRNTQREQLARPLPLHGSQLRPGERRTKTNKSAPNIRATAVDVISGVLFHIQLID